MASTYEALVQTTHRFFHHLDEMRYDALLGLMDERAVWHRQGKILEGHAQIMAALSERPRTQRVRHVVSNAFVEADGDDQATLVAYMVAYRFDDGSPRTGPVPIDGPFRMLLVRTRFARRGDQWRIVEQVLTPEFDFRPRPVSANG